MTDEPKAAVPQSRQSLPTAEEMQERGLTALADIYVQALKHLGVETFVLGFPVGAPSPVGEGYARLAGNPAILLNLIAALIRQLLPQDFENLRAEMNQGSYFELHRLAAHPSAPGSDRVH